MRTIWFTLGLAIACSSAGGGEQQGPPPEQAAGDSGAAGEGHEPKPNPALGGAAGEGSHAAGGAPAGAGGTPHSEAGQTFELAGAPSLGPPGVCAPDLTLGDDETVELDVANAANFRLLSMTPDELSVAFSTGSDAQLALYVADRDSPEAELTPALVAVPTGYEAASGAALASDGLKLVLVTTDHGGFAELTRASRDLPFSGDPDLSAFARINALKPMSGRSVGWPVLSSDGQHLYFLSYFGQGLLNLSQRDEQGVFDFGVTIDEFTLGGSAGAYKLPHGLSADERAIFYFDEATQHAMALFRSRPDAPFYDPLDLGERRGVAPNVDCSRLYSSDGAELVLQARR